MRIKQDELTKMMTEVMTEVNAPSLTAVREAMDTVARLEEQVAYAERVARLEEKVERLERELDLSRRDTSARDI